MFSTSAKFYLDTKFVIEYTYCYLLHLSPLWLVEIKVHMTFNELMNIFFGLFSPSQHKDKMHDNPCCYVSACPSL